MDQQNNLHNNTEWKIILIIALVQFINILDFMMVMPLGPDFARELNIPLNDIGIIGGSYTFAAAFSGLIAALFLDKFVRKYALLFMLLGLIIATFCGALSWNKESMIASRIIAGAFGGPLHAIAMSLIVDFIPPQRRGNAMGKVSGAFVLASVLGVPFGLEMASRFSWHAPFITTGVAGLFVLILAYFQLPYYKPVTTTYKLKTRIKHLFTMLSKKLYLMSYLAVGMAMMSGFIIIPNLASHLQANLGYPRANLGLLYFAGGFLSFFGMRLSGILTDKYSSRLAAIIFTIILFFALLTGFVFYGNFIPVILIFACFMVAMSGRMVAVQTLSSKVPQAQELGAYMSVQSSIMNICSALGAYYSSLILIDRGGQLLNVPILGISSIFLSLILLFLVFKIEKSLSKHKSQTSIAADFI